MPDAASVGPIAALWDWRRRAQALYAAVRSEADPRKGWTAWRQGRDAMFKHHPQSALDATARAGFQALPYFPYDPALRFTVALREAHGPSFAVGAGEDGSVQLHGFARTEGLEAGLGRELTLYWVGGYGGGAFLPFTDRTNGGDTYGGGRYLLDTIKGADLGTTTDGLTVLDFNFAYNPSCSYSPSYICPLAPAENQLPAAVRAGEVMMGAVGPAF